jgi:stage II sporulation protein AA (anti-sigma F factor antagonist)
MEITRIQTPGAIELRIRGRLDGYWADHLQNSLAETMREGHDRIRLELSDVNFMSSAGIAVVMKCYKQLQRIDGSLVVIRPSPQVRAVLEMTGLADVLIESGEATSERDTGPVDGTSFERAGTGFHVFDLAPGAHVRCRVIGTDAPLAASAFREEHCSSVPLRDSAFAFGIGAIGEGFSDCRDRFGEFVAIGHAAAYQPADGTNVPDYLVGSGDHASKLQVLYCLAGDGSFARLVRFDAGSAEAITLGDLATSCLEISGTDTAAVVIVGEAAALVGAALRQSPAHSGGPDLFAFPAVRSRLTFTTERAFARSLTLAVGIVSRRQQPQLRPLGKSRDLFGHFHAAAFSFGPLKRGRIDLKDTVANLFETESLLGVLHLLNDTRDVVGIGQSEFIRGACWAAPAGIWETN